MGACEEVLRLIESTLSSCFPADRRRERAEALAMRGQAYRGLGRNEDAKAAWNGAAQRYEELGDEKAAADVHARLAHLETRSQKPGQPAAEAALVESEAAPVEAEAAPTDPEPVPAEIVEPS